MRKEKCTIKFPEKLLQFREMGYNFVLSYDSIGWLIGFYS